MGNICCAEARDDTKQDMDHKTPAPMQMVEELRDDESVMEEGLTFRDSNKLKGGLDEEEGLTFVGRDTVMMDAIHNLRDDGQDAVKGIESVIIDISAHSNSGTSKGLLTQTTYDESLEERQKMFELMKTMGTAAWVVKENPSQSKRKQVWGIFGTDLNDGKGKNYDRELLEFSNDCGNSH